MIDDVLSFFTEEVGGMVELGLLAFGFFGAIAEEEAALDPCSLGAPEDEFVT